MGSLFKSKTKVTQAPFESNPWEPQQDYLKGGFSKAETALDKALGMNGGITDYTADLNDMQTTAVNGLFNTGTGTAQNIGGQMVAAGGDLAGALGQYAQNAQQMFGTSTADRTGMIRDQGMQMAENPYIQGQIDAVARDANQMLSLQSADVNANASGTGNINSTRAGVLDSLNQNAAADRVAAVSSQLRGDAFSQGMGLANDVDARVASERLAANNALGDVGKTGYDLMTQGWDTQRSGFSDALGAGSVFQQQAQNEINGQREMSQSDLDLIQKYMGIVGGNFGQSGFQSQVTQSPSIFQQLVGGATAAAGLKKS